MAKRKPSKQQENSEGPAQKRSTRKALPTASCESDPGASSSTAPVEAPAVLPGVSGDCVIPVLDSPEKKEQKRQLLEEQQMRASVALTLQYLQSSLERADRLSQRKKGLLEHVKPLRQQAATYCAQLSAAQKRLLFRKTESTDLDAVCPASLPEIRRCASKLVRQSESFCNKLD